ncbi:MAG TPA: response regulator [Polyangiaceae bacterium]
MTHDTVPLILNVDDTSTSRLVTSLILRQAGFDILEAQDGAEALKLAKTKPQLILLDVNLPDLNGFEVCRRLKSNPTTKHIPVVHLSASYISSEDRVTGLDEGADGYLTQPVQPRELVATINAILRLKRVEHALRESENWHRTLFECSHDALLVLSPPNWGIGTFNSAALRLFGVSSENELANRSIDQVAPLKQPDGSASRECLLSMIAIALTSGASSKELTMLRADGGGFPANVVLTRIESNGQLMILATLRDESEKRRLEATLAQSDRLASMGILAASLAHELNNPLAYVQYSLESLEQDLPPLLALVKRCATALRSRVVEQEFLQIVEDASLLGSDRLSDMVACAGDALEGTRRMKAMTRGLGMFSRIDSAEQADFEVNNALESAVSLASNEISQRAIVVKDYASTPVVFGSEGKLSQVFLNLLVNAAQAIDEGAVSANRITLRIWQDAANAYIEISDTGKGIAPSDLERIFEPFYTTKRPGGGTGLGLAICRSIVAEFGGTLSVSSRLSEGTRFELRLPRARDDRESVTRQLLSQCQKDVPVIRGRVLIVDDEEMLRKSMERLLEKDHDVVSVASAEAAQALLEDDPAFDAIVCDLMMSGMSGMALHEWLSVRDPTLANQVVFVTGGAFTPRASQYLAKVTNVTLEKPFDRETLKRIVASLVRSLRLCGNDVVAAANGARLPEF